MAIDSDDLREFMRELLLRWDKHHGAMLARFEAVTKQIEDHREETRAQTQAILRLLDRMSRFDDGNGGHAPA